MLQVLLVPPLLTGCSRVSEASEPSRIRIHIGLDEPGINANRWILGNNIQWTDHGDGLLDDSGQAFSQPVLDKVKALSPTVLRYPGGALTDLYHWKDGMGDPAQRGQGESFFSGNKQQVLMGTREFLELCEATGAEPLITVNTATGSAQEAADWVASVNVRRMVSSKTGKLLPQVRYWEIGNEPYVNDAGRRELWTKPDAFAAKAVLFIRAMKKADPAIRVGIPLRSDYIGAGPATPYPGYNRAVLKKIDEPFEFVALHNAYLPFNYDPTKNYKEDDYYRATMAASRVVREDFDRTRALLRKLKPGKRITLAVTEFNALYVISEQREAAYISSLAGALYVADLLRLFATTQDLEFANFWSLSGNWHFGAVDSAGRPRPAYYVLKMYGELMRGHLLSFDAEDGTFSNSRLGLVPAYRDTRLVSGLATKDKNLLRILLINKESTTQREAIVSLSQRPEIEEAGMYYITGPEPFGPADGSDAIYERTVALPTTGSPLVFQLPPRSVALITIRLKD